MSKQDVDVETGVETTGHDWDGIKELNNPLPRWWLWCFLLTIVWGVGYSIAYPAWPLISGATTGLLGFSTRGEVSAEIARVDQMNAALNTALAEVELASLTDQPDLYRYAVAGGAAVFRSHCSQCHGSGAAGAKGYPNLLDDDWLWGGDITEIATTITHGIRNDVDDDAHWSEMPAFGDILKKVEIAQVVQHVLALSGQDHDTTAAEAGAVTFEDQCSGCHGPDGTGDRDLGAPDLTDRIWLYGGDPETLTETITASRFGVMPPWGARLDQADINAVAAYVHQLGGGE